MGKVACFIFIILSIGLLLGCKMETTVFYNTKLFVWKGRRESCLILIHGGKACSERAREIGERFSDYFYPQYTIIAVDYRFSGYGGGELEDILNAISYAKHLLIKKVFLIGESHGGYLALLGATKAEVSGVIDAYGPTDLLAMQSFANSQNPQLNKDWADYIQATQKECQDTRLELTECIKKRSPYYLADKIKAPVLLLHGTEDNIVPISQSEMLAKRFKQLGKTNYRFVALKGLGHGFSLLEGQPFELIQNFLNKLRGEPS